MDIAAPKLLLHAPGLKGEKEVNLQCHSDLLSLLSPFLCLLPSLHLFVLLYLLSISLAPSLPLLTSSLCLSLSYQFISPLCLCLSVSLSFISLVISPLYPFAFLCL